MNRTALQCFWVHSLLGAITTGAWIGGVGRLAIMLSVVALDLSQAACENSS